MKAPPIRGAKARWAATRAVDRHRWQIPEPFDKSCTGKKRKSGDKIMRAQKTDLIMRGINAARAALASIALSLAAVGAAQAEPPAGGPPYTTNGTCNATCGAYEEWLRLTADQQARSKTCLSHLEDAHADEVKMIALLAQKPIPPEAQQYNLKRTQAIGAFQDCEKSSLTAPPPH